LRKSIVSSAAALLFSGIVGAADPADSAVVTSITGDKIELGVPASALRLTIPKGGLAAVNPTGSQSNPRYFNFADLDRGWVISGWIEPASSFPGAEKFWVGEFTAMKKSGLMPKEPPAPVEAGDWMALAYELSLPDSAGKVANSHIRAELVEHGTWVDLHISVTGDMPVAQARSEALALLKSIVVTKKAESNKKGS